MPDLAQGTLYIVGTPIGNLGDITLRAIETLRSVGHVAAEDTRRTRALLSHLGITGKRLYALDAHASTGKIRELVNKLQAGEHIALVTDAGMPSISDPGRDLVEAARSEEIRVVTVPGPSAVTAAIALSGLVDAAFVFLGFLPRQGRKRRTAIERIKKSAEPIVLFESPHRVQETLNDLASVIPERKAAICRELTKLHEEVRRATLRELANAGEFRGEITLVIAAPAAEQRADAEAPDLAELETQIQSRLREGASVKSVVQEFAESTTLPRRDLYTLAQKLRDALTPDE